MWRLEPVSRRSGPRPPDGARGIATSAFNDRAPRRCQTCYHAATGVDGESTRGRAAKRERGRWDPAAASRRRSPLSRGPKAWREGSSSRRASRRRRSGRRHRPAEYGGYPLAGWFTSEVACALRPSRRDGRVFSCPRATCKGGGPLAQRACKRDCPLCTHDVGGRKAR